VGFTRFGRCHDTRVSTDIDPSLGGQPPYQPHEHWMRRAVSLGERSQGLAEPNPCVGCVIVSATGQLIGEGYTSAFGGAHAEVNAVQDALSRVDDLQGATVYVTLEPCSHTGKTPPCADLLIKHKVARVVTALQDPFEQVAGRGFEKLRAAGIEVIVGVGEDEARRLHAPFIKRVTTGLPYVICKWAQTLDGKIATSTGHSQWISNAASRKRVHELRARVDAVVVGVGTVLADDPVLTARGVDVHRDARRVVIDPNLRCTPGLKLFTQSEDAEAAAPPVTLAVSAGALDPDNPVIQAVEARGGEVFVLTEKHRDRWSLKPLFKHLAQYHAATNVMVEGGAIVHGALLDESLVDEAHVYIAPKLVGDAAAPSAVTMDQAIETMDQAQLMLLVSQEVIDGDVLLIYRATM